MKISALILGIIVGTFGLLASGFVLSLGRAGSMLGEKAAWITLVEGGVGLLFSILGIVGAGLSLRRARLAGILMIISAVVGYIAIRYTYIISAPLFLVGGILALLASREGQNPGRVQEEERRTA